MCKLSALFNDSYQSRRGRDRLHWGFFQLSERSSVTARIVIFEKSGNKCPIATVTVRYPRSYCSLLERLLSKRLLIRWSVFVWCLRRSSLILLTWALLKMNKERPCRTTITCMFLRVELSRVYANSPALMSEQIKQLTGLCRRSLVLDRYGSVSPGKLK